MTHLMCLPNQKVDEIYFSELKLEGLLALDPQCGITWQNDQGLAAQIDNSATQYTYLFDIFDNDSSFLNYSKLNSDNIL